MSENLQKTNTALENIIKSLECADFSKNPKYMFFKKLAKHEKAVYPKKQMIAAKVSKFIDLSVCPTESDIDTLVLGLVINYNKLWTQVVADFNHLSFDQMSDMFEAVLTH